MCGCQEHLFDDQAHTLQHKITAANHSLATSGKFGRQAGVLKPFDLKAKKLQVELEARKIYVHKEMTRADLQKLLDQVLKGVLRVPVLLLEKPRTRVGVT